MSLVPAKQRCGTILACPALKRRHGTCKIFIGEVTADARRAQRVLETSYPLFYYIWSDHGWMKCLSETGWRWKVGSHPCRRASHRKTHDGDTGHPTAQSQVHAVVLLRFFIAT
jgi:hypothetical protein